MPLHVGTVLRSPLSPAEVVTIRVGDPSVVVELGGLPMRPEATPARTGPADLTGQLALGKRYVHEATGLELLCVEPGPGQLTIAGRPLALRTPPRR